MKQKKTDIDSRVSIWHNFGFKLSNSCFMQRELFIHTIKMSMR